MSQDNNFTNWIILLFEFLNATMNAVNHANTSRNRELYETTQEDAMRLSRNFQKFKGSLSQLESSNRRIQTGGLLMTGGLIGLGALLFKALGNQQNLNSQIKNVLQNQQRQNFQQKVRTQTNQNTDINTSQAQVNQPTTTLAPRTVTQAQMEIQTDIDMQNFLQNQADQQQLQAGSNVHVTNVVFPEHSVTSPNVRCEDRFFRIETELSRLYQHVTSNPSVNNQLIESLLPLISG